MNLAAHQRAMLGLVRGTCDTLSLDDPYLRKVASSGDLAEARGNILLWRLYVLERTCVLTVSLLRRRGMLLPTLHAYIEHCNISPFRELQPLLFLDFLKTHPDPLLVAVSQFELALAKVREDDQATYLVRWPQEPHAVLWALAQDVPLDETAPELVYTMRISSDLPHLFDTTIG